jgi:importin subunit beta-1
MNLAQLIEATESMNNAMRSEAENQLLQARNQSPGLFILACSQELSLNNLSDVVRPKAGILIKYTLLNHPEGSDALWLSLDDQTREKTKTNILGTLAYPNDTLRKVAADLIAIICAIEFPLDKWPNLIPALTTNSKNNDPEIKKSAILTLGKICDEFKTKKINLSNELVNQILAGIYFGMQAEETDDIKLISVKALADSLIFVQDIFSNQQVRQQVFQLLYQATLSENRNVRVAAFRCLIEFVKIYYDYLGEMYTAIWEATAKLIIGQDQELAILAIEVWGTIAGEDKERGASTFQDQNLGITSQVQNVLIPALLENLLDASKYNDSDDGDLSVANSTKNCLMSIAEAIKDRFLEFAVKFVGVYLIRENYVELRAGLITYTCMLDGPSHKELGPLVTQAIPTITKILMNYNKAIIKVEAATALERTAELLPDAFFQDPLFSQVVPDLTVAIRSHPRISMHVTKLWHHLGEEIMKKQNKKQQINFDFTEIINKLLENAFGDTEREYFIIIDYSLLAVMTLLLCTGNDEIKGKYVRALVEQFKGTGNIHGEKKELIQAGLLACLQTLLHKYHFDPTDPVAEEIFNLIMDMFQAYKTVTADGIFVLSALASAIGEPFKNISSRVWPYIAEGFKQTDQPELFLATLNAIVEITGACPEDAANYLGEIFKTLISLLDEKNYDKLLKLRIIMSIGDIALGSKNFIVNYVSSLNRMYEMAMNAATHSPANESAEMIDYLEQLRENVLDSYVCYFHSVTESTNPDYILDTLPIVMEFLNVTCTKQFNPSVDYMRSALAFVADVGLTFKERAAGFVKTDLTVNLINVLDKHQSNPDNLEILNYAKQVLSQY